MDVIAYFAVLTSLTLAPGPLSAILAAKTLTGDRIGALLFGGGIALGDTLIIILVCTGVGAWMESTPLVFTIGKTLAVIYILWIALGLLKKDKQSATFNPSTSKKLLAELASGAATCIASPQTLCD